MKKEGGNRVDNSVCVDMSDFFRDLFMSDYMEEVHNAMNERTIEFFENRLLLNDNDFENAFFTLLDEYLEVLGTKLGKGAFLSVFRSDPI